VKELHALSWAIIEAGFDGFTVRRVLQRVEKGELNVVEATVWLWVAQKPDSGQTQMI